VAAGEHQAQQLVIGPLVRCPGVGPLAATAPRRAARAARATRALRVIPVSKGVGDREERELARADLVTTEPVERLAAGRGGQPAPRVRRHPVPGPALDGLDKGVLHRVLGQPDVTGARRERGPDPGRLFPVSALERLRCRVHVLSLAAGMAWWRVGRDRSSGGFIGERPRNL
jgi:hypothetical protein